MTKKLLNLISGSLFLMCSASIAQPTLTATGINPVIGESFTLNNSTASISPGSAGASQTWDLSSMSGTSGGLTNVVDPSTTPNGTSFPGSNIAWSNSTGGSVSYYKTSATALQLYGMIAGTTLMPYSNPEDFLHFPFAYTNTYSDPWAVQFLSGGYTFYRTGTTTVTADSYGTLITPNGTYSNVMRVHFVQDYQDSAYIGTPYIITYYNDEYMWYKEGTHVQIAVVYNLTSSGGGPYTGGSYVTGNVGIDNSMDFISSSNLFPNPASDIVTIDFTLTEAQKVEIRLFNNIGQRVEISKIADCTQGLNIMQLDIANIPEGIYFAQILLNGNVSGTSRFVIKK
jgi:hypothetical protein